MFCVNVCVGMCVKAKVSTTNDASTNGMSGNRCGDTTKVYVNNKTKEANEKKNGTILCHFAYKNTLGFRIEQQNNHQFSESTEYA